MQAQLSSRGLFSEIKYSEERRLSVDELQNRFGNNIHEKLLVWISETDDQASIDRWIQKKIDM